MKALVRRALASNDRGNDERGNDDSEPHNRESLTKEALETFNRFKKLEDHDEARVMLRVAIGALAEEEERTIELSHAISASKVRYGALVSNLARQESSFNMEIDVARTSLAEVDQQRQQAEAQLDGARKTIASLRSEADAEAQRFHDIGKRLSELTDTHAQLESSRAALADREAALERANAARSQAEAEASRALEEAVRLRDEKGVLSERVAQAEHARDAAVGDAASGRLAADRVASQQQQATRRWRAAVSALCGDLHAELRQAARVPETGVEGRIDRSLALVTQLATLVEKDEPPPPTLTPAATSSTPSEPSSAQRAGEASASRRSTASIADRAAGRRSRPGGASPPQVSPPSPLSSTMRAAAPSEVVSAQVSTLTQRLEDARRTLSDALRGVAVEGGSDGGARRDDDAIAAAAAAARPGAPSSARAEAEVGCLIASLRQADQMISTYRSALAAGGGRDAVERSSGASAEEEVRAELACARARASTALAERDEHRSARRHLQRANRRLLQEVEEGHPPTRPAVAAPVALA